MSKVLHHLPIVLSLLATGAGCGTTRSTDTPRTATEQLLLSTAIDKAINRLDFSALDEKRVYFDPQYLAGVTDEKYVVSSMRQHLLASGAVLCEKREEADYILEARSGVVGTDRNEVMLGLPTMQTPSVVPGVPVGLPPTTVPQLTLAKKSKQRAVAKLAVFAYNRHTGRPVWQSGAAPMVADARDTWVLGTAVARKGAIQDSPLLDRDVDELEVDEGSAQAKSARVGTNDEVYYSDQQTLESPASPMGPPETADPMPNQGAAIAPPAVSIHSPPTSVAPQASPGLAPAPVVTRHRAQSPARLPSWLFERP